MYLIYPKALARPCSFAVTNEKGPRILGGCDYYFALNSARNPTLAGERDT